MQHLKCISKLIPTRSLPYRLLQTTPRVLFQRMRPHRYQSTSSVQHVGGASAGDRIETEFALLLQSLNLESKSALAAIKEILSFTQQAQLAVSEENVTQNIGFFTQLLQNLKKELSNEDISQYNPDDLLNAIQFSFAMNYDDNDLWFKIYQITSVLIQHGQLQINHLLKLLHAIDNDVELLSEQQRSQLKQEAYSSMVSQIQQSGIGAESTLQLIEAFGMITRFLDYQRYQELYDLFDQEFAKRAFELSNEQLAHILTYLVNHNQDCQPGSEIEMELLLLSSEEYVINNIKFYTREELQAIIAGFSSTGMLKQMPELVSMIETEVKSRLQQLDLEDVAYILKVLSQASVGSAELFMLIDKYIGRNMDQMRPQYLYPVLKSFYDSGHARLKLFIKFQQTVIKLAPEMDVNDVCAILRLYGKMEVQQTSIYEQLAVIIEQKLASLDETGLVNAVVSFKQAPTQRQLSVVSDLEKILLNNLDAIKVESLSQLLFAYTRFQDERKQPKILQRITDTTIQRLTLKSEQGQKLQASTILYLIMAFQKLNRSPEDFRLFIDDIVDQVQYYNDEHLQMILEYVSHLSDNHEGFEYARLAIRDEKQNRREPQNEIQM